MKFKVQLAIISAVILTVALLTPVGAYVNPVIGGGQVGSGTAPMIMPEITIDANTHKIVVKTMMGMPWMTLMGDSRPVLRPLTGTDAFNPAANYYSALNGKAYNWQYGWANDDLNKSLLPAGNKIWIEVISQSAGLKTYDKGNSYAPIFGTDGASNIWQWNEMMGMSHNAYTAAPGIGDWFATYNIYIGDATTKTPLAGYGSDTVTLTWTSIPEPATLGLMATGIIYLLRQKRKH